MKSERNRKSGRRCSRFVIFSSLAIFLLVDLFSSADAANSEPYDFLVVGAGAAGCVVANRLSESFSVLLLEVGGDPNPEQDVPAKVPNFLNGKEYVKSYTTVPQNNAGLKNNGSFVYLVGRTLGGGSGVNGQVYNRGSPHDYDYWASVTGDSTWNYANMLKYFKRIEDYHGQYPSKEQHGKGGPLTISQPRYAPGLTTWLEAGRQLGYKVADPNGPQTVGFAPIEFNRNRGRRVSSYQGYIQPILATRPHLKVIKHAEVTSILFNGNTAVGVKYRNENGDVVEVTVKKEVILSAGVLSSPVILMKSGIGPKDVLDQANINPVKYLPVGHKLQDHVYLPLYFNVKKDKAELFDPKRDLSPENLRLYEKTGDGPYSSFIGIHGQAFLVSSVRAKEQEPNPQWADINLHLLQTPSRFEIDGFADADVDDLEGSDEVSISTVMMLTRPKSYGRLTLNAENVDEDPLVDFQYLTHPDDVEATIDAVKQVIRIHEEPPAFKEQGGRYATPPVHFCRDFEFRSDEYWRCYISYFTAGSAHAGGTCRMGRGENDPDAVVDSKLRVIGIQNLRVVDTSIMPAVPNSNTMAPALVIGEKAADDILEAWKDSLITQKHEEL